jgi:hypothetical protein
MAAMRVNISGSNPVFDNSELVLGLVAPLTKTPEVPT